MDSEWPEELVTGVAEIDAQHRQVFAAIVALRTAMDQGQGREEVGRTLQFLERYVVFHFSTEERLMMASGYPGLAVHREAHDEFIRDLAAWKAQPRPNSTSTFLPIDLHYRLVMWLREHVGRVDIAFAEYLTEQRRSAVAAHEGQAPPSGPASVTR